MKTKVIFEFKQQDKDHFQMKTKLQGDVKSHHIEAIYVDLDDKMKRRHYEQSGKPTSEGRNQIPNKKKDMVAPNTSTSK